MPTTPLKKIQTRLTTCDKIFLTKEKQTLLKNLLEDAALNYRFKIEDRLKTSSTVPIRRNLHNT